MKFTATITITFGVQSVTVKLGDIEYKNGKVVFLRLNRKYMTGYVSEFMKQVQFFVPFIADSGLTYVEFKLNGHTVVLQPEISEELFAL